jgi:hypothetical protein
MICFCFEDNPSVPTMAPSYFLRGSPPWSPHGWVHALETSHLIRDKWHTLEQPCRAHLHQGNCPSHPGFFLGRIRQDSSPPAPYQRRRASSPGFHFMFHDPKNSGCVPFPVKVSRFILLQRFLPSVTGQVTASNVPIKAFAFPSFLSFFGWQMGFEPGPSSLLFKGFC